MVGVTRWDPDKEDGLPYLALMDASGNRLWDRILDHNGDEGDPNSVFATGDGGCIIGGSLGGKAALLRINDVKGLRSTDAEEPGFPHHSTAIGRRR